MSNGNCPCDAWVHPEALQIHAGLDWLPRQIARFPQFRRAMLAELQQHPSLAGWRARGDDDLGVMLIEMWAYACDVLAFYDEVIANECYVRTAQLRPSLRRLVDLLGYVPRPAVAASVLLAAITEGREPITLPAGIAFRSKAFDGEAPQIFEMDAETVIHPLNNNWAFTPVRLPVTNGEGSESAELLFESGSANLKEGDVVLLRIPRTGTEYVRAGTVQSITPITGEDGSRYDRVAFTPSIKIPSGVQPEQIGLWRATQMASPWAMENIDGDPYPFTYFRNDEYRWTVILDGVYRSIKRGQHVILQCDDEFQWFQVDKTEELLMQVQEAGGTLRRPIPPIKAVATRLFLEAEANTPSSTWIPDARDRIIVHHAFVEVGVVTVETKTTIARGDFLQLEAVRSGGVELAPVFYLPGRFLFLDKNGTGHQVRGSIDRDSRILTPDPADVLSSPLLQPVTIYGNILEASRGETVPLEILGSGDASLAGQTFQLKKKPLTYLASPTADNERAVASTLKIRVDGILWKEVASFFGAGFDDSVYIVRQNDEGETLITFGDGERGRRLPTGRDNVVASYRFGAGAKAPSAGTITQLAKPVKGLSSVRNPLPAFGGDDAEGPEKLRDHAPRSALTLGRAVSLDDFQALAAGFPGVRAVRSEWRWDGVRQGAVVKIWYIGEPGIEAGLCKTLRNRADPAVTIDVEQAKLRPFALAVVVEVDPRYQKDAVRQAVRAALLGPDTGLLTPENIGIGQPLFRSRICERVLSVEGTVAMPYLVYIDYPRLTTEVPELPGPKFAFFNKSALKPAAGCYFNVEKGALLVIPQEQPNG